MACGFAYASGGALPATKTRAWPRTLAEALVSAAESCPHGGLTIYDAAGKVSFLSYAVLLLGARRVAHGLLASPSDGGGGIAPGTHVLLAAGSSPAVQLCLFWGCLLGGVRPCIQAGSAGKEAVSADAWELLEQPPVLTVSDGCELPAGARCFDVSDWLRGDGPRQINGSFSTSVSKESPGSLAYAIVARPMGFLDRMGLRLYRYTNAGVVAHARGELLSWSYVHEAAPWTSTLAWRCMAEPTTLLAHCTTVLLARDEVHAAEVVSSGEPRAALRIASRHQVEHVAMPSLFFRRALQELRRQKCARDAFPREKPCSESNMDLSCVRLWSVEGELSMEEVVEFLELVSCQRRAGCCREPSIRLVLTSPWGSMVALGRCMTRHNIAQDFSKALRPAPGVELRALAADGCAAIPGKVGEVQVRGLVATPASNMGPSGWASICVRGSLASGCLTLVATSEGATPIRVAGVEYFPEEVEAAVEAAKGVCLGSAIAVAARMSHCSEELRGRTDSSEERGDLGLAIAFVAVDASPAAAALVVQSVRSNLTINLGIHAQVVLPLVPCDLPRNKSGQPCRTSFRRALQGGEYQSLERDAAVESGELLPGDWVFEEEFRVAPLTSVTGAAAETNAPAVGSPSTGQDAGSDDGDDIEERMEGAYHTAAASDHNVDVGVSPGTSCEAAAKELTPVLVLTGVAPTASTAASKGFLSSEAVAWAIAESLHEKGSLTQNVPASAWREDPFATVPAGPHLSHVVHCAQCSASPGSEDGSMDAAAMLCFLQAVERTRSVTKISLSPTDSRVLGSLKIVSISVGRHTRVAGDSIDPRKSLVLGLLLAAAAELPWLNVTHVDVCPSLSTNAVAAAAVGELFSSLSGNGPAEVLVDAEGQRLVRGLRPAALLPSQAQRRCLPASLRTVLLAGGAGGVGLLWAKRLDADELLILGRSPASAPRATNALMALADARADVRYLRADIADHRQLEFTLGGCGSAHRIDFAASLCEAFTPPTALRDLHPSAFVPPAEKLRGAENFLGVLAALRRSLHSGIAAAPALPVLLASSAVGVLGASRLAPYTAGARAVEAVCSRMRLAASPVDARCIALSAWSSVGITVAYPVLAQAAPAAGLHVISPQAGLLALEAIFQRFAAPRYGTLAVGVDGNHSRFSALVGSAGADATLAVATATLPGCIELVGGVVKKVLGREVKLGDSLVAVGLDSMTSMSMHSTLVAASGGLQLPGSLFYDHPTVLEISQLVHKLAKETADEVDDAESGNNAEDAVEALLEDADARRSYHLGIAREALRRGALEEARDRCGRASTGAAAGSDGLAAACALEADVLEKLGEIDAAAEAYAHAVENRQAFSGPLHPDTVIVRARQCQWAACSARDNEFAQSLRQHVWDARDSFFRYMSWPWNAWHGTAEFPMGTPPAGPSLLELRSLRLDGQLLAALPAEVGLLQRLEVLRLRRNCLATLPPSLGRLVNLRELWVTGNMLTDLPAELSTMARLQILAAEGNRFSSLPQVICSLRRLLELGLDEQRCPMQGLGDCELPAPVLSVLRARGCHAEFPGLQPPRTAGSNGALAPPNLNTVFWANNSLSSVPASLTNFSASLRLLDLAHNRIQEVGEELFALESLRDLSLAGNCLKALPIAIVRMRRLQQLWLHGNFLEALPEQLGELENLAILELHHNRLESLPASIGRLRKLNWLFAHGNRLTGGADLLRKLAELPRLKICGLGANRLQLGGVDLTGLRASFGLGWNEGLLPEDGVLSEALTTCDLFWDPLRPGQTQDLLVVTFSAQGAPIAQGQAEIRALRDALLPVDALYVCDPANAWFMQDPSFRWDGLGYFDQKIRAITQRYRCVFMWGGSMGGSAALLFACLADCVHAFSPQVDLAFTWPTFASEAIQDVFRRRIQDSVLQCRGTVTIHVGEENHNDMRHVSALPAKVKVHLHDTANHNTMKHVKNRQKLLPLLKLEISKLLVSFSNHESS